MQVYLVGGAVRDQLLGKPNKDADWVVVGATPEQMIELGYRQVGADFPVFLHPETHDEYALARTERKRGSGHKGFAVHAAPDVTLEEDLARRDLTINAIARGADGELVDPFNGCEDLRVGVLRAVTEAFSEDPLRVLRVARFAAQLPGFTVAPETVALMRRMCAAGELETLPPERAWQELFKVLAAPEPQRFFEVLSDVDGWQPFFRHWQASPPAERTSLLGIERFAFWCEGFDVATIRALCASLKAPNAHRDFAAAVVRHGEVLLGWQAVPADVLADAVGANRGWHGARHLASLAAYLEARWGVDLAPLLEAVDTINSTVRAADFKVRGPALGKALLEARVAALTDAQRLR